MYTQDFWVENIKCGGCISTITKSLMKIDGVTSVEVLEAEQKIHIASTGLLNRDLIRIELANLGYPEQGLNNLAQKAKSFVSCAIGRFNNAIEK